MAPGIRHPSSIRTRFLLLVLVGAVVPLVLIGLWLTRAVVRAGEDLLRTELDKSVQKITDATEQRWSHRHGDLALLAANDVAHRLLAGGPPGTLAPADSAYLEELATGLTETVPRFEYRDAAGRIRWSRRTTVDTPGVRDPRTPAPVEPTLMMELPVMTAAGAHPLGRMVAHVTLSAVIPSDTSLRLPNGARLQIVQRSPRRVLILGAVPDSVLGLDRFTVGEVGWLAVHRSLRDPEIDLILAAPLTDYVQPFERVARTGVLTLMIVALLALLLSAFLTTRLTRSLERLAIAAEAVAAGDLDHRVEGNGDDEVGRVAAAFNRMMENLRRSLGELSKRQSLAAIGEYAASLAHQVRNGLTAVRVDLQRVEEKTAGDSPGRTLIARSLENVKRLDGIVSASLRVGRHDRAPRRLDLRHVLRSAAQNADGAFSERGATLAPTASYGNEAWILGDAIALEQLFLNLLLNAAQALQQGGRAEIRADVDGSDFLIAVTDTGTGIPPDHVERVLDPFFSTKAEGTGLGLSIARQIATAHGGSLRLESVQGKGTRVEVRLPLAAAPTVIAAATS